MRKLKNNELARIGVDQFKKIPKIPLIIILENIRSLNNIGSVFRTADAFIIEKIFLCGYTATPPNKDIHKTALGSTESVEWEYRKNIEDLILELKEKKVFVWSIEQAKNSKKLNGLTICRNTKHAIIFGNEIKGVSQNAIDLSNDVIEIDQFGTKHSLNISNCSAILIWEFFKSLS
ncbi:MAG: RNA methyltransferase [Flavobacteriales bacterium]|nr:RNA methyltransferase [Flavobacteriaceae bacterium]MAV81671.1 RNA methyltransferase [Flavobacteriales bacterium]